MAERPSNPVFVVGIFRSGTSLLYALLNRHPQVALMYESNLLDFPDLLGKYRLSRNWLERQEFYNGALSRHGLPLHCGRSGLEDVNCPVDLYRAFGTQKNATIWGEKSPFYPLRLKQLARNHPHCALILIWRKPGEIYESVARAGRTSPFFGRVGMLDRTIYYHEQMVRQVVELSRTGVRMHHLTYDELVGNTEKVCRDLCDFLGVTFDAGMLNLRAADFSSVNSGQHHSHLRRGVIERQRYDPAAERAVLEKLGRYHARWHRLSRGWINNTTPAPDTVEPSWRERLPHRLRGYFYCHLDMLIRVGFEFLPLPWLKRYRKWKESFLSRPRVVPHSAGKENG